MKTNFQNWRVTLCLALFILLLGGCTHFIIPARGLVALEGARISLPQDGVKRELWQGKQMDINYSISQNSNVAVVSGEVVIHDNVLMTFRKMSRLLVMLNFLDADGGVLESIDITPVYSTYGAVSEPMEFRKTVEIPQGNTSFAFSYFGQFQGDTTDKSDSWEIYYFPFN